MGEGAAVNEHFRAYQRDDIEALLSRRPGETKLGENVLTISGDDIAAGLGNSSARFVLLGIPEDIGVRANYGIGGTHTAWHPALKALLNTQATDAVPGDNMLVLGAFDFSAWMTASESAEVPVLRGLTGQIDDAVSPVIAAIAAAGKIPVVIGGGHNNAYPLLKGIASVAGSAVNCINLDAHSDYRMVEGRHSGNGFRYARQDGFLDRYAMIGLHEAYNSKAVMQEIGADSGLQFSRYEDIFLEEKISLRQAVNAALQHTAGARTGIELDMDCIEKTLSSAMTPVGISAIHARQYVRWCAAGANAAYLHLAEGATTLRDGREDAGVAKLIAYLVRDFVVSAK